MLWHHRFLDFFMTWTLYARSNWNVYTLMNSRYSGVYVLFNVHPIIDSRKNHIVSSSGVHADWLNLKSRRFINVRKSRLNFLCLVVEHRTNVITRIFNKNWLYVVMQEIKVNGLRWIFVTCKDPQYNNRLIIPRICSTYHVEILAQFVKHVKQVNKYSDCPGQSNK